MVRKITLLCVFAMASLQLSLAQTANDISLLSASLDRYALLSEDNFITLEVKNNGTKAITSLETTWNDGTKDHTAIVRTYIAAGDIATVQHPTPVNYDSVVEKNISVNIPKANNIIDARSEDNSQTIRFNTVSRRGTKAVVAEKLTGTWCQYCTMGIAAFDYMHEKYPKTFVGIAIHSSDPMGYKAYASKTGIRGLPGYNLERKYNGQSIGSKTTMEKGYKERVKMEVPADLNASATLSGSELSIVAKANFYTDLSSSKLRLGIVILENDVRGTSSGYSQKNAYSGRGTDAGGYEKLPNPVPASKMVYNHVARSILGTYEGQSGSIPSSVKDGDVAEYTFTYNIPSSYKKDNLKIAILLIDGSNRTIVNAKEVSVKDALSVDKVSKIAAVKMYPNPAIDNLTVSFNAENKNYNITVTDMMGRVISNKAYNNLSGVQNINVSTAKLSAGNYLVSISNSEVSHTNLIQVK